MILFPDIKGCSLQLLEGVWHDFQGLLHCAQAKKSIFSHTICQVSQHPHRAHSFSFSSSFSSSIFPNISCRISSHNSHLIQCSTDNLLTANDGIRLYEVISGHDFVLPHLFRNRPNKMLQACVSKGSNESAIQLKASIICHLTYLSCHVT